MTVSDVGSIVGVDVALTVSFSEAEVQPTSVKMDNANYNFFIFPPVSTVVLII